MHSLSAIKRGALLAAPLFLILAVLAGCSSNDKGRLAMKLILGEGVGSIALHPLDGKAAIAGNGRIYFADLTAEPPRVDEMSVGGKIGALAYFLEGSQLLAYDQSSNRMLVIDPATKKILRTRILEDKGTIRDFYVDEINEQILLARDSVFNVGTISLENLRPLKEIPVGGSVQKMLPSGGGDLLLLTHNSDSVAKLRLIDRKYTASVLVDAQPKGFVLQENKVWAAAKNISPKVKTMLGALVVVDAQNPRLLDRIEIPWLPGYLSDWGKGLALIEKKGTRLHFLKWNGQVISTLDLGNYTGDMVFHVSLNRLMITLPNEGTLLLVQPPEIAAGEMSQM